MLCRFRLGLPVAPVAIQCVIGREDHHAVADEYGFHSVSCMWGGLRTLLHHRIRDVLFRWSSAALLNPVRESHPFSSDTQRQMDLIFRAGGRREIAGDVAVTFPLKNDHAVAAARASPGGAATAYEAHKVERYGVLCAEEGMTLAPLVVDVFGAWGATGLHMLHMIATEWSKRSRLHRTISTQLVFNAINVEVQRGVARLLLANAVPAGSV